MGWHGGIGWFRGNPSPNWFWLWDIWINMMYMFTLFIRFSNTGSVGGGGSLPCHSRKSSILVFCLCGTGSQRGEMGHDQMVPELNGRSLSVNPRCLKLSRECETYIDLLPTFLTVFSLDLRAGEITSWTLVFVCKYSSCLGAFVILRELWPTVSSMENHALSAELGVSWGYSIILPTYLLVALGRWSWWSCGNGRLSSQEAHTAVAYVCDVSGKGELTLPLEARLGTSWPWPMEVHGCVFVINIVSIRSIRSARSISYCYV